MSPETALEIAARWTDALSHRTATAARAVPNSPAFALNKRRRDLASIAAVHIHSSSRHK